MQGHQEVLLPKEDQMHSTLTTLIDRLDRRVLKGTSVLDWGCPVPSFGDLPNARVATLGLNPSSREFLDESGNELDGPSRRFHTLRSLNLESWSEADARHLRLILASCYDYFNRNPYDRWFKKLDEVVSGTSASYYCQAIKACHLDLIPFATEEKWMQLSPLQRSFLMSATSDTLALLLEDSSIQILILNGRSVVNKFEEIAGLRLRRRPMRSWSLPRRAGPGVTGVAFKGVVTEISGIDLGRELLVLGFNHNLQSSFGVTKDVILAIRRWIARASDGVLQ